MAQNTRATYYTVTLQFTKIKIGFWAVLEDSGRGGSWFYSISMQGYTTYIMIRGHEPILTTDPFHEKIAKNDAVFYNGTLYDCLERILDLNNQCLNIYLVEKYEDEKRKVQSAQG